MTDTSSSKKRVINIGVLSNELEDRYHSLYFHGLLEQYHKGLQDQWKDFNINVFLFIGRALERVDPQGGLEDLSRGKTYNSIFELGQSDRLHGLLILSGSLANFVDFDQLITFLKPFPPIPKVSLAYKIEGIPSITVNNCYGMEQLTRHFITVHNYEKIAFIRGPQGNLEAQERFEVFMNTCRDLGVAIKEEYICQGDFVFQSGRQAVRTLLDERKIFPQAIIGANDEMAYGAYRELKKRDISIPQQIAIGGFDDIDIVRQLKAPFTTVNQPIKKLATLGLELLINQIIHPEKEHHDFILDTEMVVRRSCGCDTSRSFQAPGNESIDREIIKISLHPDATQFWLKNKYDLMEHLEKYLNLDIGLEDIYLYLKHIYEVQNIQITILEDLYHILFILQNHMVEQGKYPGERIVELFNYIETYSHELLFKKRLIYLNSIQEYSYRSRALYDRLLLSTNVETLSNNLLDLIRALNIPSAFFYLYKDGEQVSSKTPCQSFFTYERESFPQVDQNFTAGNLLPREVWQKDNCALYIVKPLFYKEVNHGFGAIELIGDNLFQYENISTQVSAILKGIDIWKENQSAKKEIFEATKKRNETNRLLQESIELNKAMHSKLMESEKMTTIGKMVAGVTHEIRNPLGIGITLTSHMDGQMDQFYKDFQENQLKKSSMENYLSTIEESTQSLLRNLQYVADQIRNFKQIAVDQHGIQYGEVDIKNFIETTVESMKYTLKGKRIDLHCHIPPDIKLTSYPGAISQVITNLILNSIKHGFPGGRKGNIRLTGTVEDRIFTLKVQDDGVGMDEDTRKRAFDPFFTTKKEMDGTGLGLSIVENMVRQKLKGRISLESEYQMGTLFTIELPMETHR